MLILELSSISVLAPQNYAGRYLTTRISDPFSIALLKGYKFDAGEIIESSIRRFQKNVKRGLIPHPAMITRLYILAGVNGIWAEEETCSKVSPLTLTRVIKGPKSIKRKELEIMEVAKENEEEEEEKVGMEQILLESQLPVEDEMHNRRSPLIHSPPNVRETFSEPAVFHEQPRKCRDHGHVGVNEEGNEGEREKVGATIEDQRGIYGG